MIKKLKILSVVSFMLIMFIGPHIGGPIIVFIGLGITINPFSDLNNEFIVSLFLLITLFLFIYSAFKPNKKRDLWIFCIGGLVLATPIVYQINNLLGHNKFSFHNQWPFILTVSLFLIIYTITLVTIHEQLFKPKEQ